MVLGRIESIRGTLEGVMHCLGEMVALIHKHRSGVLLTMHAAIIVISMFVAFQLRFDFSIPTEYQPYLILALGAAATGKLLVFYSFGLCRGLTKHVSIVEAVDSIRWNIFASFCFVIACFAIIGPNFPRSVYILDFLICMLLTLGLRFNLRIYNELSAMGRASKSSAGMLIYGAGVAGVQLAREIRTNPSLDREVRGFLDDDPLKLGITIGGVAVLGTGSDISSVVDRSKGAIEEVVIAIPSASGTERKRALEWCREAGLAVKTLPGLGELLDARNTLADKVRDISLEDLLGRDPVQLDEGRIREAITGRVVLVTGAAGSIGAEICGQVATYGPTQLIALDQAESDLFRIDLELRNQFPELHLVPVIGDIRDPRRVNEIVSRFRPETIFHAAAYKHVPMMETQPIEVVSTNVQGTWNLALAAKRNRVLDFVMISSDKAVNPTNVMGLTKRVAELVVGCMEFEPTNITKFVSVRFGNVLGSNGSVVPTFQEQIASGGPITVTHPEIERYFMTIPEAVQLVLQASTMGKRSETFVLDMGEPVKIVDLAKNMIRLADLEPEKDVKIEYVGLRPGEKLYEELITDGENVVPTYHEKIKIFQGQNFKLKTVDAWMARLSRLIDTRDESEIVAHMARMAPEYQPGSLWRLAAAHSGTSNPTRELAMAVGA